MKIHAPYGKNIWNRSCSRRVVDTRATFLYRFTLRKLSSFFLLFLSLIVCSTSIIPLNANVINACDEKTTSTRSQLYQPNDISGVSETIRVGLFMLRPSSTCHSTHPPTHPPFPTSPIHPSSPPPLAPTPFPPSKLVVRSDFGSIKRQTLKVNALVTISYTQEFHYGNSCIAAQHRK